MHGVGALGQLLIRNISTWPRTSSAGVCWLKQALVKTCWGSEGRVGVGLRPAGDT